MPISADRQWLPNIIRDPDPCQREESLRAVLLSHEFADPAKRGKLRALASLGVAVAAATPTRWLSPGAGTIQDTTWEDDGGVQVVPIAVRGPLDEPVELSWNTKALRSLLGDFRPDILQIEAEPWTPVAVAATAAARRLKIPSVIVTREGLPRSLGIMEGLRRDRVLRRADGVIAATTLAERLLPKLGDTPRIAVIPPLGVTPPTLAAREPREGLAIGFLGRLIPERGLDLLFRACVTLLGPWTITVVGTGPSQEELEALAERLGIAARVMWLGALPRQAIDTVWPTLDCVALPSRSTERWVETVGRAALEAMAHGLPVVASTSGVLPDLVGSAGRLVPEDDVPALAVALAELLPDPGLRAELGTIGRRRVMEQFSDTAVARRTLDFWSSLLVAAAEAETPAGKEPVNA